MDARAWKNKYIFLKLINELVFAGSAAVAETLGAKVVQVTKERGCLGGSVD